MPTAFVEINGKQAELEYPEGMPREEVIKRAQQFAAGGPPSPQPADALEAEVVPEGPGVLESLAESPIGKILRAATTAMSPGAALGLPAGAEEFPLETLGRGLVSGATFGAPEAALGAVSPELSQQFSEQDIENPIARIAGQVLGSLTPGAGPMKLFTGAGKALRAVPGLKGAGALSKLGRLAAQGGLSSEATSALENVLSRIGGEANGKYVPGVSGALGAALPLGTAGVGAVGRGALGLGKAAVGGLKEAIPRSAVLEGVGSYLSQKGLKQAQKAMGSQTPKQIQKSLQSSLTDARIDMSKDYAKTINPIVKKIGSKQLQAPTTIDRMNVLLRDKLGIFDESLSGKSLSAEINKGLGDMDTGPTKRLLQRVAGKRDQLIKGKNFATLRALKSDFEKAAKFGDPSRGEQERIFGNLSHEMGKDINDSIVKHSGERAAGKVSAVLRRYGEFIENEKVLQKVISKKNPEAMIKSLASDVPESVLEQISRQVPQVKEPLGAAVLQDIISRPTASTRSLGDLARQSQALGDIMDVYGKENIKRVLSPEAMSKLTGAESASNLWLDKALEALSKTPQLRPSALPQGFLPSQLYPIGEKIVR